MSRSLLSRIFSRLNERQKTVRTRAVLRLGDRRESVLILVMKAIPAQTGIRLYWIKAANGFRRLLAEAQ
jgi:hypothetical protein